MQLNPLGSKTFRSLLPIIAPFFFWGTAMVAMKGVIAHTTPLFMAGVRLLPAGILILIVAARSGRSQPRTAIAWLWICLFALVDGTMFQGFLAEGLVRTGAGLGSVIIDSQPLAVALLSSWLFGEAIGLWGWIGLVIGIIGIASIGLSQQAWVSNLVVTNSLALSFDWHDLFNSGEWLMLLASLSMAVGTVTIRFVTPHADPVVATGWHMILGGISLFLFSGIWESQQWGQINWHDSIALGYSTVFGSAIAYGLFFYMASRGNLTSLSSLTFLTPVFALLFGNFFLAEYLNTWQWMGVCLTLVSVLSINQREKLSDKFKQILLGAANQKRPNISSIFLQESSGSVVPIKITEVEERIPARNINKEL